MKRWGVLIGLVICCHAALANVQPGDLRRQFFDDQTDTLNVGEDSVTVVLSNATVPLERGIMVLFYESGNVGITMDIAAQLATRLNRNGWSALLLPSQLKQNELPPMPASEEIEPHPRAYSVSHSVDYERSRATMLMLTNSLSQYLQNRNGFIVFVTQGMSAALLSDILSGEVSFAPDAMVVVSPFWPQRERNNQLATVLANTRFPVLDLGLAKESPWAAATRIDRLNAATTSLKLQYRQRALQHIAAQSISDSPLAHSMHNAMPAQAIVDASSSPFAIEVSNRIYGWLTHLGW